jgi:peptidoglycan/xylan/chitin deacetylase (PgdA/CDA1 family)
MIFRDDDICATTPTALLQSAHNIFLTNGVIHTLALVSQHLDEEFAQNLVAYIKATPLFDLQLHCWNHVDLTEDMARTELHLLQSLEMIERVFGVRPTTLYPPWNRSNKNTQEIAEALGLTVSTDKISLEGYLRCGGLAREEVINFHYWSPHEVELLRKAVPIYAAHQQRQRLNLLNAKAPT